MCEITLRSQRLMGHDNPSLLGFWRFVSVVAVEAVMEAAVHTEGPRPGPAPHTPHDLLKILLRSGNPMMHPFKEVMLDDTVQL